MNITLQGTNLAITDDLRAYVDEKMQDAFRSFGDMNLEPVEVAIELELTTQHHRKSEQLFRAEANVTVPGRLIRAEASSHNLYQAIVQMKHTLTREIRTWRERLIDESREGARIATAIPTPEEEPVEDAGEELWGSWEDEEEQAEEAEDTLEEEDWKEEDERDYI